MTLPAAKVSAWNLPNTLTVMRILVVPFFGWLLLVDHGADVGLRWWALALFVGAVLTDRIDGDIARRRGLVTDFGKVADPIADKAITGMAFVGLSVLGELPWWITIPVLVREWGITAMRFFIIRHSVMPAGQGGKTKTALQALALGFFIAPLWTLPEPDVWMWVAWIIMAAAVILTLVTGIDIALKGRRLRQTSERTRRKRAERLARRAGGR
ncbi:CDP-diacylglycerol--glycerol-3-phosphate 3-phosphatidyltransferase [Nostocoides australiense]|nr:CDP-diacylglycerol--glycerol-3-phosphate 3-phosphatidyltransferase [Actinomycetota bacterium]MCB1301749.1 CDP-diacylglycerol--glycerol-3-phosphate 3-phosphatidyltransferase [Tetrasphaera sp.]HPF80315.1 CDP-diacylglycerol--glycerol-3-phosphate 3-phosphatidyltransferase [Tetrasphaera australiensis]HRW01702.1 CDP-diacylglycerol--glycerol-3-phosphate 3-phosphatidyltransferase [Tetrasphaera sp.]